MRLSEAYQTLELSENATPEEAKKKYRTLTKKYHPDVNKDPTSEDKFKKINEAYERIQKGADDPEPLFQGNPFSGSPFNPFGNPFGNNPFQQQRSFNFETVEFNVSISFKESVLGTKKEVSYSRHSKCSNCNGAGSIKIDNGCSSCGGRGQTTSNQHGMIFIQTCSKCHGRTNSKPCATCNSEGTIKTTASITISIPAGIADGNTLRLQGMGNYAGSFMGTADQYSDAFCHISVSPITGLSLKDNDVVYSLDISLLDALKGCEKSVTTIFGSKDIKIPAQSKNQEEIIIPNLGVAGKGNQKIILNVHYPIDLNKLIEVLENQCLSI